VRLRCSVGTLPARTRPVAVATRRRPRNRLIVALVTPALLRSLQLTVVRLPRLIVHVNGAGVGFDDPPDGGMVGLDGVPGLEGVPGLDGVDPPPAGGVAGTLTGSAADTPMPHVDSTLAAVST
jgi:hypothetical protein